ncbi:MAG: SpoIID/LytB domain-containing protein [Actinomycetota bacterium]|nr:SpoIID/LytB domain-containing protein [Actinomycetota bacterium]
MRKKKVAIALLLTTLVLMSLKTGVFGQQSASHGVGLCMAGVKVMAEGGRDYQSILTYYYTGTQITSWNTNVNIRVGVHSDPTAITVTGTAPFTVAADNGSLGGNANDSCTVRWTGSGYEVSLSNGSIGSSTNSVRIDPGSATLKVNGWNSWDGSSRQVRGIIEVRFITDSKKAVDNNRLWAINEVNLEEYVAGILEEPDTWPMEGLKVLAVAARTYALNKISTGGKHSPSFHLCATGCCQQYIGVWNGPNHRIAQQQTAGQVVTYNGSPIVAAYSGSCGGATRTNESVWGETPLSYLRSVVCPCGQTPPGDIYGRVISRITGGAIPGTCVRVGDKIMPTIPSGEFRFTGIPVGTHTVYYDAPGYQGQTQVIEVKSRATMNCPTCILYPPTGEIRGRVVNQAWQTIPGTCIRINSSLMPTNPGGEFRFTRVHDGIYTVYYDAPGYQGQTQVIEVRNGAPTQCPTCVLSTLGEIRGRVVNQAWQTIPGTCIRINNSLMPTNPGGEFRFTRVHDGIYTVYYDAPGYQGQTQVIEVKAGSVTVCPTVIMSP